jgi:flagellin-like hook-associated protein FlgL
MRITNLNVSSNVTNTIRDLDQQRFKLDRQISTGQKITYPEDDGIRTGRLIQTDALKSKLAQYQRNASYASEFLNAGHLNLDSLQQINQRAQEISRVAGSQINQSSAETYGHEIEQLVEEALNRINSQHRGRALFGGTEYKANFGSTDVRVGQERQKTLSLKNGLVGTDGISGSREIKSAESVVFQLNGREYVVKATTDGLSTDRISEIAKDLINQDQGILADSPSLPNPPDLNAGYEAFVRVAPPPHDYRNQHAELYAKISASGDLEVYGTVDEDFSASATFVTTWDPSLYFPEQVDDKLNEKTSELFPGSTYDDLTDQDKDLVRSHVFSDDLSVYNLTGPQLDQLTGQTGTVGGNFVIIDKGSQIFLEDVTFTNDAWRRSGSVINQTQIDSLSFANVLDVEAYFSDNTINAVGDIPATSWERKISVSENLSNGTSTFDTIHAEQWKRLQTFKLGNVVEFEGKFWESQIPNNTNHRPSVDSDAYWKELPSDYSAEREDWQMEAVGVKQRFFFMAPDGQMFEDDTDALQYTSDLLLKSTNRLYNDPTTLQGDVQSLVKEVKYAVTDFSVQGSVSNAIATFDPKTLEYALSAAQKGGDVIDAPYLKGQIDRYTDGFQPAQGSVFSYEGNYYLSTDPLSFDVTQLADLRDTNREGGGVFFLGKELPNEGKELIFQNGDSISGKKGDYIFSRGFDPENNPIVQYHVALQDFSNMQALDDDTIFQTLPSYATRQGSEWSSSSSYDKGQIVLYKGNYFQCQLDNFNNKIALQDALNSEILVKPDDEFITNDQGQEVANDVWLPLGESLDYVFKFKTTHDDSPKVSIFPAGTSGKDASAEAIVDADGDVVGLKLLDPGRYFFGSSSDGAVPPDFEKASITLQDGTQLSANIIWEENVADPGPFRISGFELVDDGQISGHNALSSPRVGDTFSFATGSKTFLDHRDNDGKLLSVSYQGGDKNAITRVGKDTDVSYMLDASKGNTAALGNVVNSLVELRDGLFDAAKSNAPSTVPETEKDLIAIEDAIIDRMGELSATMVRMETVRTHDEDYAMALDKQISKDLEIDMSEAIMRLTRVSTAYQAAMQVGAQLLNTSLLNYL